MSASTAFRLSRICARLAGVGARCSRGSGGAATASALLFFFVDTGDLKCPTVVVGQFAVPLDGRPARWLPRAVPGLLLLRLGARGLLGAALGLRLADLLLRRSPRWWLALALAALALLRHGDLDPDLLDHLGRCLRRPRSD